MRVQRHARHPEERVYLVALRRDYLARGGPPGLSGRMFLTNGLTSCSVFGMGAVCIVNIVCLFILKHTLSRCINAREPNETNR